MSVPFGTAIDGGVTVSPVTPSPLGDVVAASAAVTPTPGTIRPATTTVAVGRRSPNSDPTTVVPGESAITSPPGATAAIVPSALVQGTRPVNACEPSE